MASRIQRGASRSEGDLRVALQSPEITRVEKEVKRAEKAALTAQVGLDTLKKMEVLQMRYEEAVLQKKKVSQNDGEMEQGSCGGP